ncbi:MAG: DNA-3-methyladenine glycosylase I [Candidatus Woesearchaeota archaeon]|nr:DNA-3-methyladenine glycosylase I [Candidatus Woesearchaeota archaeon]
MPPKTYTIPAKPKTDAQFLEVIALVIFIMRFNGEIVHKRWPLITKSFYNFNIDKVRTKTVEDFLGKPGVINNKAKIKAIIANAQRCHDLIKKHGSMKQWVDTTVQTHKKDPIFNQNLREQCQEFEHIGSMTSEWLDYVFTKAKNKPMVCKHGEKPP